MSMQREPDALGPLEGSEEYFEGYFSGKIHETPESPPVGADEALLPPPQDMGEDG